MFCTFLHGLCFIFIIIQFFAKEKLDISKELTEGTIHCKPGAVVLLLETMYTLLTHRE